MKHATGIAAVALALGLGLMAAPASAKETIEAYIARMSNGNATSLLPTDLIVMLRGGAFKLLPGSLVNTGGGGGGSGLVTNGGIGDILTSDGAFGFGAPITPAVNVPTLLGAFTSSNFYAALSSGKTGTGSVVFSVNPAFTTPNLGIPSAVDLTNAINIPAGQLTGTVAIGRLGTSGTPSSATFLRGDNTWATPAGSGNVSGPGSSVNGNIAIWSGSGGNALIDSGKALPVGAIVGTTDTQTLSGKTISGASNTLNVRLNVDVSATLPNASLAAMAGHTFKGNNTGISAQPTDLTATLLTAELNAFVGDSGAGGTKGLVPAPSSGDAAAGKFLKADGTFAVPPGGSASPGGSSGALQYNNAGAFGGATVATGLDMTAGVLSLTNVANDQTAAAGGNYTIVSNDSAKTILVTGGGTTTLAQAGTSGFGAGWGPCILNAGSTNSTLSTTTSIFAGAGGGTSLTLRKNDTVCPSSNGTNYNTSYIYSGLGHTASALMIGGGNTAAPTVLGSLGTTTTLLHGNAAGPPSFGPVSLTADVTGTLPVANGGTGVTTSTGSGANVLSTSPSLTTPALGTPSAVDLTNATAAPALPAIGWVPGSVPTTMTVFTVPTGRTATVTDIIGAVDTAAGGTATLAFYIASSGTACASGTAMHTGSGFDANGTANTNQTITLTSTALSAGQRVCAVASGAGWTSTHTGAGAVTVRARM